MGASKEFYDLSDAKTIIVLRIHNSDTDSPNSAIYIIGRLFQELCRELEETSIATWRRRKEAGIRTPDMPPIEEISLTPWYTYGAA
jgi:hypothetical protein